MKKILILGAIALFAGSAVAFAGNNKQPKVKVGVEVLRDNGFKQLKGKRVGLITNPTGADSDLKSTIDILFEAPDVELKALFAPEHGVRGDVHAGDKIGDTVDPKTGVKVYSLYGKNRRPTKEMLDSIDVLIYDIQDNGCRSYTFISTMGVCMESAAEFGKEFMVLDRPNPVSGNKVEGNLVEPEWISFVSKFPIPYLYGLTPGELAMMLNGEKMNKNGAQCKLTVIPMKGWKRNMTFEETGQPWILPSPHIPQPASAIYYPATGILGELYYVSIGVGYTLPFQMIAAEWIKAEELSDAMNALNLPGIKFRPIHVKPFYSVGQGKNLQGIQLYITDIEAANLSLVQFYIMQELARLYPEGKIFDNADKKRFNMFDKVSGSDNIRKLFSKNYQAADIEEYWNKDVEAFKAKKAKYHLYK